MFIHKRSRKKWALLLVLFVGGVSAYDAPIGIPDPQWGAIHPIDLVSPAQPGSWPSSEVPGYYYIDPDDIAATNTSNDYGYPDKPRATINKNIVYPPGTYMEVHGDWSDDLTGSLRLKFDCTEVDPCWLRGSSDISAPIFTHMLEFQDAKYLFIENLDSNGGEKAGFSIIGDDAHHVVIRNSKIRNKAWNGNSSGVSIRPFDGGKVHDIVIYNSDFRELGDWQTLVDEDFHGVGPTLFGLGDDAGSVTTELYNVWILNNNFYHISGNSVQVNAGTISSADCSRNFDCSYYEHLHHVYIGFNTSSQLRQSGYWAKQSSDVIVSQNIAHDHRAHGSQPGDGFGYQYGPNNLWIIYNEFYDANNGVRQSDTSASISGPQTNTTYIIGNLIYDIHDEDPGYNPANGFRSGQGINLWQGSQNRYIVDNTIYNVDGGINSHQEGPVVIEGNVIVNTSDVDYFVTASNSSAVVDVLKNLFWNDSRIIQFKWIGDVYTSLTEFQAATSECNGCIIADPLFQNATLDPLTRDFTVHANSEIVESNDQPDEVVDVYQRFQDLYGLDIRVDTIGTVRPSGPNKDLGAFEFPAPTSPPNTPTPTDLLIP